jgi:hypothetical protein
VSGGAEGVEAEADAADGRGVARGEAVAKDGLGAVGDGGELGALVGVEGGGVAVEEASIPKPTSIAELACLRKTSRRAVTCSRGGRSSLTFSRSPGLMGIVGTVAQP